MTVCGVCDVCGRRYKFHILVDGVEVCVVGWDVSASETYGTVLASIYAICYLSNR